MDDLGLLLEELIDVCGEWYELGMHLCLGDMGAIIQQQASDIRDRLLEVLKTWLTASDNTSWKALTDALRSPSVRANGLAGGLERTYCLPKDMLESKQLTLIISMGIDRWMQCLCVYISVTRVSDESE